MPPRRRLLSPDMSTRRKELSGLARDATPARPRNKLPPLTAVNMAPRGKAVMAMFAAIISSSGHVEQQQKAVVDMHAFAPGGVHAADGRGSERLRSRAPSLISSWSVAL